MNERRKAAPTRAGGAVYPTPRLVLLAGAGAPLALLIGLMVPEYWVVALGWLALLAGAAMVDGVVALAAGDPATSAGTPATAGVGEPLRVELTSDFAGRAPRGAVEYALALDRRLHPGGRAAATAAPGSANWRAAIDLVPERRGDPALDQIWTRWRGPLGLVWRQVRRPANAHIVVTPALGAVRDAALRLFQRDARFGNQVQLLTGGAQEFEALSEFQPGRDRRAIDWTASARHMKLLARDYRIERDNRLVIAIDAGRSMAEPVAGMPRVDRAVAGALLLGWAALKAQDRVSLFPFASRPQGHSPAYASPRDFIKLQTAAAAIDYGHDESNFTLALATLGSQLNRRALIVLFTEFTDPTSAELMIRAAGHLVRKHRLICVVMHDPDLAALEKQVPAAPEDMIRANVAAALLRDRRLVITRLERLGVDVLDLPHDQIGTGVLDGWLNRKRRGGL